MTSGFWTNVIVLILLVIVLVSTTSALGVGITDMLGQFPLFDVVIGVMDHQPLGTILANKGFINIILDILDFLTIAFIVECLQDFAYKKWINGDVKFIDRIFSMPIKFAISVLMRFCMVVILYYGKTQLGKMGPLFSSGVFVFVAVLMLIHTFRENDIWGFFSKAIFPLLLAIVDMLGFYYLCEGIYRSTIGLDGASLMLIGVIIIAIIRGIKLLKIH